MNFKKITSGNIEHAYENFIKSINKNNDYKKEIQKKRLPSNTSTLKNNVNYPISKSPESIPHTKDKTIKEKILPNVLKKNESKKINIEEKKSINEYTRYNQKRKKEVERNPIINSYTHNRMQINNNIKNNINNRNKSLKHFKSNEHGNNNISYQLSENNLNQNWKKNLIKNKEKKSIYEYYNRNSLNNNNNNTINNIYKVTNNIYDEKNLNKNKNNYSNKITYKCIYNNHTFTESKNLPNYNDLSQNSSNINLNNKISQDNLRNRDLNHIRYNNQTFENNYKTKNNNYPKLNVNSSNNVHILHDGSYELNNTDNHNNRNVQNNISSFSKFLSNSSSQITSHDFYKNTPYNFYSLKKPMKNDEETNPQNLTINLTNIDKNNTESISTNTKGLSTIKYMDNTSKASNISVNNDNKNITSKKYINFMKEYKDNNNMKKYNLSLNSDYTKPSENHNKYFDLSMIIPSNNQKNNLDINNNNSYVNENINKTNNYFYINKNKNNKLKEKSHENNYNNNVYNNKSNHIYNNNPSSIIAPTRNDNEKNNEISSFIQNRTLDDIYNNNDESKVKYEHEKKIREITVDLSPRQKSFNNNKAYNITPNFHNKNKIYENQIDKYNINNIKPKPKSTIESCIITFDKPKKNNNNSYDKQIKPINSNDDISYNKIKYIKKKVSINNDIPIPNNNKYLENSGMNIKNDNNNINFVYNKNRSVQKLYQKPVNKRLSNSYGNLLFKNNENTNVEFGTSSPNQNANKKLNNDDDLKSNIYNRSPLLTNYNYKINDDSEKEQIISPISEKYNKLSYNENISNNINNKYYMNNKLNKFKINSNLSHNNSPSNKNELITDQNNNSNKIKNIYIKKTKAYSDLNNNSINKKDTPDKIIAISNRSDAIKDENNSPKDDKDKKIEYDKKELNKITTFEVYDLHKKDKISKLNIKSFSKKKEIKQKPKLLYMFFRKYYKLYMIQPKKEKMYITKFVKKPSKKPIISISYISKIKYDYVFKVPISSYEYYTKKIVPDSVILPKIGIEYMSKILITNKKEFKNKIINEKDKLLNNNNILQEKKTKYRKYQKRPIKNRIILIKKTSKNQNDNNNDNYKNKNKNNEYKNRIILIKDNNKKDKKISQEKKEDLNKDYYKHNKLNNNDKNNNNIEKITKNTIENNKNEIKDNKSIIKNKLINIIEEEKLPDNKKFDNEKKLISNNENISFNINMNNQKIIIDSKNNDYKNPSKLILFDKAINNLTVNAQSTKANFNGVLDQLSLNGNLIKSTLINLNVINNNFNYSINNKDNSLLSIISNSNISKELDNNIINKKNTFKIKVIIKGIKKGCKHDFLKNYKHDNNLKISDILREPLTSEKDIERENKINLIIKEDLENFIIFYKKENNKNNIMKYNYSIIEQLIIKIKLDIVDIINGCLNVCSDLIYTKKYFIIIIEYIKNIIQHYKCNYLTDINFNNIHIKVLKLFLSVNDIKIYDNIKYKILGSLLYISINNSLFFINDFNIFKQANEQIKDKIKKVINNCDNSKSFLSKIEI